MGPAAEFALFFSPLTLCLMEGNSLRNRILCRGRLPERAAFERDTFMEEGCGPHFAPEDLTAPAER
jgi:hypothetical protein